MNRPARLLVLALAAATTFAATSCGKSPTAPETTSPPPEVEPATPVKAVITSISVTKFPSKKTNGDDWDASLIVSSRRPDLYVLLNVPGTPIDYMSNTVNNAEFGHTYKFTQPYDIYSGQLPATIPFASTHRIYMMDKDVGGDDDVVGWITVNLPNAYPHDNSRTLDYTFADSGNRIHVRVQGTWGY